MIVVGPLIGRYRLTVRTEPSQGLNTGSIPVSATKLPPISQQAHARIVLPAETSLLPASSMLSNFLTIRALAAGESVWNRTAASQRRAVMIEEAVMDRRKTLVRVDAKHRHQPERCVYDSQRRSCRFRQNVSFGICAEQIGPSAAEQQPAHSGKQTGRSPGQPSRFEAPGGPRVTQHAGGEWNSRLLERGDPSPQILDGQPQLSKLLASSADGGPRLAPPSCRRLVLRPRRQQLYQHVENPKWQYDQDHGRKQPFPRCKSHLVGCVP